MLCSAGLGVVKQSNRSEPGKPLPKIASGAVTALRQEEPGTFLPLIILLRVGGKKRGGKGRSKFYTCLKGIRGKLKWQR